MNIKNVLIASCLVLLVFTVLFYTAKTLFNRILLWQHPVRKSSQGLTLSNQTQRQADGQTAKRQTRFTKLLSTTTFFVHWDGDCPQNIPSSVQQVPLMVAIRKLSS